MNIAIITGSSGLIGGESVDFFADKFDLIIGIDNNLIMPYFFLRADRIGINIAVTKAKRRTLIITFSINLFLNKKI